MPITSEFNRLLLKHPLATQKARLTTTFRHPSALRLFRVQEKFCRTKSRHSAPLEQHARLQQQLQQRERT